MTAQDLKRHLISIAITFVSTFFLVFSFALSDEAFTFSRSAIMGVLGGALIAGIRAVAKVVYEIARSVLSDK